ncbi:MAG: MerR family transcriptional regulator [Ruminococcaceae bacterium]|nr:MerR family transcriptional regulator [Oscillospiraceae bacterium]
MKINELGKMLNISCANIRFYEKEGLLNPERKDNGYREYDENEISILKKIIVYRKLGISIPNIKDVFNGKLTLGEAIDDSMSSINNELTELAVSAKLCTDLKAQGVENSTFDEDFYWNEINRMESKGEEFYNFIGVDINAVEKGKSDTKYKVILYLTSAFSFLFTLVVGFSRYGLVLAEYGDMVGVSELHHLPVIQATTPVCIVLTVILVIVSIIVHKNGVVNGKKYWTLFASGILMAVVSVGLTICISYETAIFDECYADITLSDEEAIKIDNEYKVYFPFYDALYEYVGTEFNYTYSRCEIPDAVHIHIQNFSWHEDDVLYDAEYFETKDNLLLNQYSLQKGAPVIYGEDSIAYPEGVTKTKNGVEYLIHQYENYYEIRIIDEISYFSIVLRDFDKMVKIGEEEFTDLALQQYELVKISAKNTKGESKRLLDEF